MGMSKLMNFATVLNFTKFELPSGKQGWIQHVGVEFIDL
jgi:hypothetical protein